MPRGGTPFRPINYSKEKLRGTSPQYREYVPSPYFGSSVFPWFAAKQRQEYQQKQRAGQPKEPLPVLD
jgi:hypothetical protein